MCKQMVLAILMIAGTLGTIPESKLRICQICPSADGTAVDNDSACNIRSARLILLRISGIGIPVLLHSLIDVPSEFVPPVDLLGTDPLHFPCCKEEDHKIQQRYHDGE